MTKLAQGCADGRRGGVAPPSIFKFARKLVKSQLGSKRVGHSIFCDLFLLLSNNLITIGGQLVRTPPNRYLGISLNWSM